MFDNLSGPIHTHGTTIVRVDGIDHWVDSSMLTNVALPLIPREATRHDDPVSPVWSEPVDDLWRVWWTSAGRTARRSAASSSTTTSTAEHYLARYEASRGMSPFNTAALRDAQHRRRARSASRSASASNAAPSGITSAPLGDDRDRVLIEEFGYSEAIVARLPADDPAPDPQE